MSLVLLVEGHDLQYQKPLRDDIFPSLSLDFFPRFSSMTIKDHFVSCNILKPVTHFQNLFFIKFLTCL